MSGVIKNESGVLEKYGSSKKREIRERANSIAEEEKKFKENIMTQLQLLEVDIQKFTQRKSKKMETIVSSMSRRLVNIKETLNDVKIEDKIADFSLSVEKHIDLVIGQACSLLAVMENDIGCRTVKPSMHVVDHIKE